jgi:hypothetical protein
MLPDPQDGDLFATNAHPYANNENASPNNNNRSSNNNVITEFDTQGFPDASVVHGGYDTGTSVYMSVYVYMRASILSLFSPPFFLSLERHQLESFKRGK